MTTAVNLKDFENSYFDGFVVVDLQIEYLLVRCMTYEINSGLLDLIMPEKK